MTKQQLIDFELRIKSLFEQGELPCLVHLSGGNEDQLISIFNKVRPQDWVFSTHRSHYHYLLKGGTTESLENKIVNGQSMFVFDRSLNFLSSSVLAGTACVAAGVSASIKEKGEDSRVWCFVGDAAEDEGHFYEAVRYVSGHDLPCTFIIEDNDRSCDTSKSQRRGSSDAFNWPSCVRRYSYSCTYPHGGVGTDKRVVFKPEAVARHLS